MASTLTLDTTEPSRTYLYPPKKRNPFGTKVVWHTSMDVPGLTAMRSTLENLLEHLGKIQDKECLKAPSPIQDQQTTIDNFSIVGREGNGFARTIKDSIYVRVNNPTLNKSIGKHNLPHVWGGILVNIPELQFKHQRELPTHQQSQKISLTPPRTCQLCISADIDNIPQTWRS